MTALPDPNEEKASSSEEQETRFVRPEKFDPRQRQTYRRLEHLYEISKRLANFNRLETTLPSILDLVANVFPLLSAVLIEKKGHEYHTTLWPTVGLDRRQHDLAILYAKTCLEYFADPSIRAEPAAGGRGPTPFPPAEEFKAALGGEGLGQFLVQPLAVDHVPVFGVLQLQGSSPLSEDDLKFANAVGNQIAVALDRLRMIERDQANNQSVIDERDLELHTSRSLVSDLQLERDLREKFVSTLTHDLRTPLAAARIIAQLIFRQSDDPEVCRKMSDRILFNIDRIDRMIQDLLDANRIRAGEKLPLFIVRCDLVTIARETLALVSTIHGDRFDFQTSHSEIIGYWSGDALKRALENLLNNAIKYGAPDRRVRLKIAKTDLGALVSVHNEGDPITPEDRAGLFKQFTRSRSAQKSRIRGWGIGLSLVHGIIDAHEGRVWVESAAGQGTTFCFEIPSDARH